MTEQRGTAPMDDPDFRDYLDREITQAFVDGPGKHLTLVILAATTAAVVLNNIG